MKLSLHCFILISDQKLCYLDNCRYIVWDVEWIKDLILFIHYCSIFGPFPILYIVNISKSSTVLKIKFHATELENVGIGWD